MSSPKISVVMSVFNGEDFVVDAIECILKQTYRDFEFIVINDGSSDATLQIMREYAAKDARIRIIDQENTGLTVALRRGINEAKGDFIARMDVDDVSLPTRFEKQMALFERRPELIAVSTDVEHFFDDGSIYTVAQLRRNMELLPLLLVFSNVIGGHGQMIFRRQAYMDAGGYDTSVRYAQDDELWTRLADQGPFAVVPETLYRYRTGHNNITAVFGDKQAASSALTRQKQFKKITGLDISEDLARAIRSCFMHGPPEQTSVANTWQTGSAMLVATDAFFRNNPHLRKEKFDALVRFAKRWFIRQTEVKSISPVLRLTIFANMVRLSFAAIWALIRNGPRQPALRSTEPAKTT